MLDSELKQFYDVAVIKIKETLPTDRLSVEEHLFKFSIDYNHLSELLWSKCNRKTTDSYVQYLYEICIEHLMCASINANINETDIYNDIKDYYDQIASVTEKTLDDMLVATLTLNANEVLAEPTFRLAMATKALELKYNLTINQIFEHYKT